MKSNRTLLIVVTMALALSACSYEEERPQTQANQVVPVPKAAPLNVEPAPALPGPAPTIDATSLKKRIDAGEKATIVCVRTSDTSPVIKGAIKVNEDDIVTWSDKIKKDAFLAVYCTCPEDQASQRAVRLLRDNGFGNAFVLEHGLKGWTAAGGAVTGGAPTAAPAKTPPQGPTKAK